MDKPSRVEAVIFDMDGLMLDSEQMAKIAWRRALADWGLVLPDDLYLQLIGRAAPDTKALLIQAFGAALPVEEAYARKQRYLDEAIALGGVPIKPGLLELLDFLDIRRIPKAVASSTHRAFVLRKLGIAGVIARFDAIACGDEVANGKPAPDVFLLAAERIGIAAARCVVLEDSDAGIHGAHAAGMIPILVPDLKPPSAEIVALAHRVFPSLLEVRGYLAALHTGRSLT
jgi:HAD superfamily hydrolase (TIGR01509 family)